MITNIKYSMRSDNTVDVRLYYNNEFAPSGWSVYSLDGDIVRRCADNGVTRWDASRDAEIVSEIKSMSKAPLENAYLRFKRLPKDGRSRNHLTGELEQGVSVYALTWDIVKGCWAVDSTGHAGAMIINMVMGSEMYVVSGIQCGVGSDGEPVIKDARIVGRAMWDEKKGGITLA